MIAGAHSLLALLVRTVRLSPLPGASPAPAPAPEPSAPTPTPPAASAHPALEAGPTQAAPNPVRAPVRLPAPVPTRVLVAPGLEALYRRDEPEASRRLAAGSDSECGEPGASPASPREIERLVREQGDSQVRAIPLGALFPPDARATLCIRREGRDQPAGEPPPTHQWSARLELTLPRLGEVALVVSVHEELACVSARAASAASRAELAAGAPMLAAALERNALVLERIEVAAHET